MLLKLAPLCRISMEAANLLLFRHCTDLPHMLVEGDPCGCGGLLPFIVLWLAVSLVVAVTPHFYHSR